MILTLRVECVMGLYLTKDCVRTIEIDEQDTLNDLHVAIQSAVRFDNDHLYSFYLANNESPFAKKQWLSESESTDDMWDDFAKITLGSLWPMGRKKLFYHFDFGDDWVFEVRKLRGTKEKQPKTTYPRVIEKIGPNPKQYPNCDSD